MSIRTNYVVPVADYGDIEIKSKASGSGFEIDVSLVDLSNGVIDLTTDEGEDLFNALSLVTGRGPVDA